MFGNESSRLRSITENSALPISRHPSRQQDSVSGSAPESLRTFKVFLGHIGSCKMGKEYHYEPLDHSLSQIRVFTLLPASEFSSPLRGRLTIQSFSPRPIAYEALSYVWGEQGGDETLEVDCMPLAITSNLSLALRYLRYANRSRDLWIDAVCINQDSPEDKSREVRKMRQIYSSASRVLIWLGEEDIEKGIAINELKLLAQNGFDHSINFKEAHHIWAKVGVLTRCPWWSRVWTVQEGVVANNDSLLICGHNQASWTLFVDILEYITSSRISGYPKNAGTYPYLDFARVYRVYQTTKTIPLEDLIYASQQRNACDPRDHIYALLGLVEKPFFEPFEPDYSQSISWAFQTAVTTIIKQRQDLRFLMYIVLAHTYSSYIGRPSWGHDFTADVELLRGDSDFLRYRYSIEHEGATTGRKYCQIQHDVRKSIIKLTGTVIGSIEIAESLFSEPLAESITDPWIEYGPLYSPYLDPFVPWLLKTMERFTATTREAWTKRLAPEIVDKKIRAGDVWRTFLNGADINYYKSNCRDLKPLGFVDEFELLQSYSTLDAWRLLRSQHESEKGGNERNAKLARAIFRNIIRNLSNSETRQWCLFTTTNGYAGSAVRELQHGDVVCILFGCALPLILRPQADGTHVIVDAGYVDGVMGGEFLRDKAHYTDTEFLIS